MSLLLIIFLVNMSLLVIGIFISWLDIRMFGSGLYLALVSLVSLLIVLAFCIVGTDEQTEPTVAKQMWSKSRQTMRRITTVRRNDSNDLMLYSKQADSAITPHKSTSVRYALPPSHEDSSPTHSASTSDPSAANVTNEKQQCVVQMHSDKSNNNSLEAACENTVIYL